MHIFINIVLVMSWKIKKIYTDTRERRIFCSNLYFKTFNWQCENFIMASWILKYFRKALMQAKYIKTEEHIDKAYPKESHLFVEVLIFIIDIDQ